MVNIFFVLQKYNLIHCIIGKRNNEKAETTDENGAENDGETNDEDENDDEDATHVDVKGDTQEKNGNYFILLLLQKTYVFIL